jgi:hypothetical protein
VCVGARSRLPPSFHSPSLPPSPHSLAQRESKRARGRGREGRWKEEGMGAGVLLRRPLRSCMGVRAFNNKGYGEATLC